MSNEHVGAFDQAAAADAIARCTAAVPVLDELLAAHAAIRLTAVEDWSGPYRDGFDQLFPALQRDLQRARDDIAALASALATSAEWAAAGQALRDAERVTRHGPR
jgi:hypothetical protein